MGSNNNQSPYLLFDFSPDAIVVTDASFHIVYLNPIASRLFESSPTVLLGKEFLAILSPKERNLFSNKFLKKFNHNPSSVLVDTTEAITVSGHAYPIELFISRLNDQGKDFNIIFLRNLDIRKKYIDELHLLQILIRDISNAETFLSAIELTLKNVCKSFNWEYGEAWRKNNLKESFHFLTGWKVEGVDLETFAEERSKTTITLNDEILSSLSGGDLIWSSQLSSSNLGFEKVNLASEASLKTCIGLPIHSGEELFAFILFFTREEDEIEENVISILSSLSTQLSILLQKKRIEEELKEREYFINQIAEISPNIVSVHDIINNKSIYTNRELTTSLGYSSSDLLKMGDNIFKEMVHPEDIPKVLERNSNYDKLKDGEVIEIEIRIKTKSGDWRWFNTRAKIFKRTPEGKPWITISSAIDVTNAVNDRIHLEESKKSLKELNISLEQKVAQRTRELELLTIELRNREELLSLIMNSVPAFLSYIDKNYVYNFANNKYQELSFINGDITGKTVEDAIIKEQYKKNLPYLKLGLEGEEVSFETTVELKDGTKKHIYVTYIPDISQTYEIRGLVVLGVDLTERIEFENRLNEQNDQLKKINHDLETFVYIASHELKTPITNIEGLLYVFEDILEEGNIENNKLSIVINMMRESTYNFHKVIKNLSDINRIQRNDNEDLSEISLGEILAEVKKDLSEMMEETNALIKESIEDCPKIVFSRRNIRAVVYNLLLNAIQYRDPNRPLFIEVTCNDIEEYLLLEFEDNGLGIKKENQDKVFSLFKRYNTSTQGSGVGLYMVKRIVEENGGKIEINSEESRGTVFKIYLKKSQKIDPNE